MTTTERPSRPIARPALIISICVLALIASGFAHAATHWVWLGFLNLIILGVGGFALLWLIGSILALTLGMIVGRTRR